jgi:hypothetical protein
MNEYPSENEGIELLPVPPLRAGMVNGFALATLFNAFITAKNSLAPVEFAASQIKESAETRAAILELRKTIIMADTVEKAPITHRRHISNKGRNLALKPIYDPTADSREPSLNELQKVEVPELYAGED